MKSMLEFTLPEEAEDLQDALRGSSLKGAAQQFDNFIRRVDKHEDFNEDVQAMIDRIREQWFEEMRDERLWE